MCDPAGAPGSPVEMSITRTSSALTLHWSEGETGSAPVTGYVVESRPSGELPPALKVEVRFTLRLQLEADSLRPAEQNQVSSPVLMKTLKRT